MEINNGPLQNVFEMKGNDQEGSIRPLVRTRQEGVTYRYLHSNSWNVAGLGPAPEERVPSARPLCLALREGENGSYG